MGARPVANLNALRFGSPGHPKMRHLIAGVVSGIGGYGNCVGVPTVGGEVDFHPAYDGNILVNAMTVGRSEEHTSELQSLMRISYAVFCLKKKNIKHPTRYNIYPYKQT